MNERPFLRRLSRALASFVAGFEMLFTGRRFVDPRDFGAVGDGIADDTAALQSALDLGHSLRGGRDIYRITDTLVVRNGSAIKGVRFAPSFSLISRSTLTVAPGSHGVVIKDNIITGARVLPTAA